MAGICELAAIGNVSACGVYCRGSQVRGRGNLAALPGMIIATIISVPVRLRLALPVGSSCFGVSYSAAFRVRCQAALCDDRKMWSLIGVDESEVTDYCRRLSPRATESVLFDNRNGNQDVRGELVEPMPVRGVGESLTRTIQ